MRERRRFESAERRRSENFTILLERHRRRSSTEAKRLALIAYIARMLQFAKCHFTQTAADSLAAANSGSVMVPH
jgi:hypothetical protein